jgi:uncharacterized protein (DUF1697 family)
MTIYIALLRTVIVGGTGTQPVADLKELCMELSIRRVERYIASGNAVFSSCLSAARIQARLKKRLMLYDRVSTRIVARDDSPERRLAHIHSPIRRRKPPGAVGQHPGAR